MKQRHHLLDQSPRGRVHPVTVLEGQHAAHASKFNLEDARHHLELIHLSYAVRHAASDRIVHDVRVGRPTRTREHRVEERRQLSHGLVLEQLRITRGVDRHPHSGGA